MITVRYKRVVLPRVPAHIRPYTELTILARWLNSIDLPDVEECFGGYLVPVPE